MPIGACLTHGPAAQLMQPGNHGSTFGGNPIACAAALATVETIESENLAQRASELGSHLLQAFSTALADCDKVKQVRGCGLMIGIELSEPCGELVAQAAAKGLLINVASGNVVRLLPPLTFSDQQAEQLVDSLVPLIKAF